MIERDADTVGQVVSLEFGVRSRPIVRERFDLRASVGMIVERECDRLPARAEQARKVRAEELIERALVAGSHALNELSVIHTRIRACVAYAGSVAGRAAGRNCL